ncbi:hypothetical protein M3F63_00010 [Brachybacterium muris]|uniref:hypothetical protein n=1 Tax=Brachybacterium muris TaxID=219301 RepID=UPI00223AF35A|nr:hypothetical protein [Brachybacterium muris]MCT2176065.1 hypothetical protein [Brachybacterium muris]
MNNTVLRDLGGAAPTSVSEWEDALTAALSSTPESLANAGLRARQAVQAKYSFKANATHWADAVGIEIFGAGR